MSAMNSEKIAEFESFQSGTGIVSLKDWTVVRFAGEESRTFLHSFCTAHTKQFNLGDSAEAHILNDKGKILSYGWMQYFENEILFITMPNQFETIFGHLDKYNFQEVVQITEATHEFQIGFAHGNSGLNSSTPVCNGTWSKLEGQEPETWTRPGEWFGHGVWVLQKVQRVKP